MAVPAKAKRTTLAPLTVDSVVYIVARAELDFKREMILPTNEPAGKLLFARYFNDHLFMRFIELDPEAAIACPEEEYRSTLQELTKDRAWFYAWHGDLIGPSRLSHDKVAAYAFHELHLDLTAHHLGSELIDDKLIHFANLHLYPESSHV